jgi:hypothetical protein
MTFGSAMMSRFASKIASKPSPMYSGSEAAILEGSSLF